MRHKILIIMKGFKNNGPGHMMFIFDTISTLKFINIYLFKILIS